MIVFVLRHHSPVEQDREPLRIPLRLEVRRIALAHVRERGGVVLFRRGDLREREFQLRLCLRDRNLVVAGIDLNQQLARLHTIVIFGVNPDDGAVDA